MSSISQAKSAAKSPREAVSVARLRELLAYDPATGALTWIVRRAPSAPAGAVAGGIDGGGYRRVSVDDQYYFGHRIAWALLHGAWPEVCIDHINGIRDDNRAANLRAATAAENCRNRKPKAQSGAKGVYPTAEGRWYATIYVRGKSKYLGRFDKVELAAAAYAEAAKAAFGAFARHSNEQS